MNDLTEKQDLKRLRASALVPSKREMTALARRVRPHLMAVPIVDYRPILSGASSVNVPTPSEKGR